MIKPPNLPPIEARESYFGMHPRLAKKLGAWFLALSLVSTAYSYAEQYGGDSETIFFQSELCEPFTPQTQLINLPKNSEVGLSKIIENQVIQAGSGSSIGEFESPFRLDLAERLNQVFDFLENEQYEFTMEKSGVSVSIYSNGESPLTPTEFTELYEFGINNYNGYPLPEMRHHMECYQKLLFEDKIAADVPLWVFLVDKNQPNTCLSWGMLVNFDSEEQRQAICDHSGFSAPIRLKLFNKTIFEAFAVIITPNTASSDPEVIAKKIRTRTFHEASAVGHLGDYQTQTPSPIHMNEESVKLRTKYTEQLFKQMQP